MPKKFVNPRKAPEYTVNEPIEMHGLIISKKLDPDFEHTPWDKSKWMYEVKMSEHFDSFWIRGDMISNTQYGGIG